MTATLDPQTAFTGRLFGAAAGALELLTVYLGDRLNLYAALSEQPLSSSELAEATGIDERYAREWLECQAVCGLLELDGDRFALPPEHAGALLDENSLAYAAPMARLVPALAGVLGQLEEAFRTGDGVPYERYGAEFREGQQDFTRPQYVNGAGLLEPVLPDAHARLTEGGRLLDVVCGAGIFCLETAKRYPRARIEASTSTRRRSTWPAPTPARRGSTCASQSATPPSPD
jgi:winged helix-turn-helix protein